MDYHVFKKTITQNGHSKSFWYYWYYQPVSRKRIQKVCKNCRTRKEALMFVEKLPPMTKNVKRLRDIAEAMYLPGFAHYERCQQTGHTMTMNTLIENRRYLKLIIKQFGNKRLEDLTASEVLQFLIPLKYKASWKNHFVSVLSEIYVEANWIGLSVTKPEFPRFHSQPNRSDLITDEEAEILFKVENFDFDSVFLLFLLEYSAGLRISEARAFKAEQILGNGLVLVNGFLDKVTNEKRPYNKSGSLDNLRWRVAIIPSQTEFLLLQYIRKNNIKPNEYLFTTSTGNPYGLRWLSKKFSEAIVRCGLAERGRKITSHSLRYSYITKMRMIYDSDIVRQMAGHTSIKMTDYYTRFSIEAMTKQLLPISNEINRQNFK